MLLIEGGNLWYFVALWCWLKIFSFGKRSWKWNKYKYHLVQKKTIKLTFCLYLSVCRYRLELRINWMMLLILSFSRSSFNFKSSSFLTISKSFKTWMSSSWKCLFISASSLAIAWMQNSVSILLIISSNIWRILLTWIWNSNFRVAFSP